MKHTIVIIGILALSFQFSVFSQELKYIFDKEQVLQYEHVFERQFTYAGHKRMEQRVKSLEFKVLGISRNKYEMSLKVVSSYRKTRFLDEYSDRSDQFETAFDTTAITLVNYADQGRIIEFEMDAWGKIIDISGIPEFQNEVAMKIHQRGRSADKVKIHYGFLTARISKEYYTKLINDIFPDVSQINNSKETETARWVLHVTELRTKHRWLENKSDQNTEYSFESDYFISKLGKPDSVLLFLKNQHGTLDWDHNTNCLNSLDYQGIDINRMISDEYREIRNFNIQYYVRPPGRISYPGNIKVRRIGQYISSDQPAHIIGDIRGCDSCKIVIKLPTNSLKPDIRVFSIEEQGHSLTFSGNLPYGPDMVTIYFPEDYSSYKSYESDPRQIRIFVRPGDTIRFSVDLRKFGKDLGFFGQTWKEQSLLNSYILGYSNFHPQITLNEISSAKRRFEQERNEYCEEFIQWFNFEAKYEELEYRLNEIMGPNLNQIGFNPEDSLPSFTNYLNNYNGYKSEAYKRFIKRMVTTFSVTSKYQGLNGDPYLNMLESVGIVLRGWDKYFVLADLTEARMRIFYNPIAQQYYNYFIRLYRGSEYGNYLETEWEGYKKILPGEKIENFDFKDSNGKVHSIRDFRGKVVYMSCMTELPKKRRLLIGVEKIIYARRNLEADTKKHLGIRFFTSNPKPTQSQLDSLQSINTIYVTDEESVNTFLTILAGRQDLSIALDKDQRIVKYNNWPTASSAVYNLHSWPQLEEVVKVPKTINRQTLWLVSTIIITTAIFILILIWSRNKKRETKQALKRKMAELELGAVRSRMNPHFLFNALSSIQNLVNSNELEKANLYLADFGDLLRKILDQSSRNQITLAEEVDTLRTYLELEALRFPFKYTLEVAEDINPQEFEIPPLFIQPHVENAIIHGISGLGDKGVVQIRFELSDGNLEVIVEDNGPGLKKENHSSGLGKGWELTNQRVQLLKNQWGKNISVKMEELEENSGMRVKFVIPVENMKS